MSDDKKMFLGLTAGLVLLVGVGLGWSGGLMVGLVSGGAMALFTGFLVWQGWDRI